LRIEDYALIGNSNTGALVGRDGSIDWLCMPRFDSGACFAALLGTPENGRWKIAPANGTISSRRAYRGNTLVLETEFETADGAATLIDFMPHARNDDIVDLVRIVVGRRGEMPMRFEMTLRFDYGHVIPWVTRRGHGIHAVAGPDAVVVRTPVPTHGEKLATAANFTVNAGQILPFLLTRYPSHHSEPQELDAHAALARTTEQWTHWSDRFTRNTPWRAAVIRSLITLKALTYRPTGGIVAALTTSLPERIGGVRNWDYRYCWLRDATFTLYALMSSGYLEEARAWREWLLRAAAGEPHKLQIMYGIAGERRLTEMELPWLAGYENSRPVRIGNAAHGQFQLDVYGEIMDALYLARPRNGAHDDSWNLQRALMGFLEEAWHQPDDGIWEVRGPRRHFTHSKVMAWVAFDRAVKAIERSGLPGPRDRWIRIRDTIAKDIHQHAFNAQRNAFVQSYGSDELDAALLMMPLVGFISARDPRMVGTVAAIERELMREGFVMRYVNHDAVDGLPPGEGAFLPCSFWLADNMALAGRYAEGRELFERLLSLRNDVGLLAEEYDPVERRLLGNFPQAFTHVALINTAYNLSAGQGPAHQRSAQ
jgi:GH15 family glucan-1,4-alpha-glucosidase